MYFEAQNPDLAIVSRPPTKQKVLFIHQSPKKVFSSFRIPTQLVLLQNRFCQNEQSKDAISQASFFECFRAAGEKTFTSYIIPIFKRRYQSWHYCLKIFHIQTFHVAQCKKLLVTAELVVFIIVSCHIRLFNLLSFHIAVIHRAGLVCIFLGICLFCISRYVLLVAQC